MKVCQLLARFSYLAITDVITAMGNTALVRLTRSIQMNGVDAWENTIPEMMFSASAKDRLIGLKLYSHISIVMIAMGLWQKLDMRMPKAKT